MSTPKHWKGYDPNFLNGFEVSLPNISSYNKDLSQDLETGETELKYIYYSSFHSKVRRLPILTASNIYRDKLIPISRTGDFTTDSRIPEEDQFSDELYKDLNRKQQSNKFKMDKGHMVRREDVQWDRSGNEEKAQEAAEATFFYTNACPQHHEVNGSGGIWFNLESSILRRGRSIEPRKAIVFSGPILHKNDPFLVFEEATETIRCPIKFWKVVYYVNPAGELRRAAFLMSQRDEVERDGHVSYGTKLLEILESVQKPFLEFEDKEKYQVRVSLIEDLTKIVFPKAYEALNKGEFRKLELRINESFNLENDKGLPQDEDSISVEGMIL